MKTCPVCQREQRDLTGGGLGFCENEFHQREEKVMPRRDGNTQPAKKPAKKAMPAKPAPEQPTKKVPDKKPTPRKGY